MIGFTGATLDRADQLRLDPSRLAALAASAEARLLRLDGLDPVLDEAGRLAWDVLPADGDLIFLGLHAGAPRFAPLRKVDSSKPAWNSFGLLSLMPPADAAVWGAARSLLAWHDRHGFCANCGAPTLPFRAGWGRRCDACSAEHFPRVDPVVIMLAEFGGRVLVGRQPRYPARRYSALAGFMEPGESIEEAVARELFEEAGLKAKSVRYVASQPWPFPGSLMMACIAEVTGEALVIDRTELDDAMWVDAEAVAAALDGRDGAPFLAPPPIAIAHSLLRFWLSGRV